MHTGHNLKFQLPKTSTVNVKFRCQPILLNPKHVLLIFVKHTERNPSQSKETEAERLEVKCQVSLTEVEETAEVEVGTVEDLKPFITH